MRRRRHRQAHRQPGARAHRPHRRRGGSRLLGRRRAPRGGLAQLARHRRCPLQFGVASHRCSCRGAASEVSDRLGELRRTSMPPRAAFRRAADRREVSRLAAAQRLSRHAAARHIARRGLSAQAMVEGKARICGSAASAWIARRYLSKRRRALPPGLAPTLLSILAHAGAPTSMCIWSAWCSTSWHRRAGTTSGAPHAVSCTRGEPSGSWRNCHGIV